MWFNHRPDEVRDAPNPTPGVCIHTTEPRRYWFAGSTPDLALVLARAVLGDVVDAPETTVDFGTRLESEFVRERRISGPTITTAGSPYIVGGM